MKRIAIIFCALLNYEAAFALDGIAILGVHHPRFDCRRVVRSLTPGVNYGIATLYKTFGFDRTCYDLLLADRDLRAVQIHIANEVCVRNKRCGRYELFYGHTVRSMQRRLAKETRLLRKFRREVAEAYEFYVPSLPDRTACYVSPSLESNMKGKAAKNLLQAVGDVWAARCGVVWNPVRPTTTKGLINECHYPQECGEGACVASTDGVDRGSIPEDEYIAWRKRHSNCLLVLEWRGWYNLIEPGPFIDPRFRSLESPFSSRGQALR